MGPYAADGESVMAALVKEPDLKQRAPQGFGLRSQRE